MLRFEAITHLAEREDALRRLGVAELRLFGSVAADEARPDSDLDILIDHGPGKFSLFALVGIKLFIESELAVETDVVTRAGLHPMLRDTIERSAVKVF